MCIDCMCYTEGKTILSEIFRHQLLLKDFTFTRIQCTCSTSHRQYSLEYFGTESCRNISFSQVLSAYIISRATILGNISAPAAAIFSETFRHQLLPKYFISHRFSAHIPQAKTWSISAPRTAEIFHFPVS